LNKPCFCIYVCMYVFMYVCMYVDMSTIAVGARAVASWTLIRAKSMVLFEGSGLLSGTQTPEGMGNKDREGEREREQENPKS
jgi:hypothetical protein